MFAFNLEELLSHKAAGYLELSGARMALLEIGSGFWSIRRQIETLVGPGLTNSVFQQAGVNGGASFARSFIPSQDLDAPVAFSNCLNIYQLAGFGRFEITSSNWPLGQIKIRADQTFEAWMQQQNNHPASAPCCAYTAGVLVGFINVISNRKDVVCIEQSCQGMGADYCCFELLPADEVADRSVVALTPDPGLGRQINLLEMLFERMPMGIAVLDREYRIQRYNPTWHEFAERYAPPASKPLAPGVGYFEHLPGSETSVQPLFERVLAGETIRQNNVRLETQGIETYWDIVLAPLIENGNPVGILNVSVDATDRVTALQNLEQRVAERTRELTTLLRVSSDINAMLSLEHLLETILEQLKTVVDYSGASVLTINDTHLQVRAYRGPIPKENAYQLRFPIHNAALNQEVIRQRRPLRIEDIRADEPLAQMFRQTAGDQLETTFGYVRSWLGVPMTVKGELLGMLTLDHNLPGFFSAHQADLVQTFANQVAVALENAQLYQTEQLQRQESERRREVAESLRGIMAVLNSERSSQEIFDDISARSAQLMRADGCLIYSVQDRILTNESMFNLPAELAGLKTGEMYLGAANRSLLEGKPVQIQDARPYLDELLTRSELTDFQRRWYEPIRATYASYIGFPLIVRKQLFGGLIFYYRSRQNFNAEDIQLGAMLGEQAALAIENARLQQETERRAEESETLFAVQQAITSKLEMDEIMQLIADEARRLTGTDISAVYLLDRDELVISYVSGDVPHNILGYRLSIDDSIAGQVIHNREAILVPDTLADARVDRAAADQVQARSLLIVPLISDQKPIGTITVANRTPGTFRPDVESLLTKLATSVVINLDNARLYQAESDRREVAESLRETLAVLNSKQPLDEILDHIAAQAVRLLDAHSAVIYRILPGSQEMLIQAGNGVPTAFREIGSIPLYEGGAMQSLFDRQTYVIRDIQTYLGNLKPESVPEQNKFHQWLQIIKQNYGAYLGMPLIIDDEIYGSLGLYYLDSEDFSEEQIELGRALANQAVLAIENAHLLERAEEAAIAAERNRLARDLHDAVTQTLFSASMIADVLPKIWERNSEEGQRRLEELRQLTRGALSEMRTLLVELRPAALEDTDLCGLIGHQVNAFSARTRMPINYERSCTQNPPPEIKEAFYRIVQEAFNNIAKHAEAASVQVRLDCQPGRAEISIQDDGAGFDPHSAQSEGLGLGIMAERALTIGAQLKIHSQIGQGARLELIWQKND